MAAEPQLEPSHCDHLTSQRIAKRVELALAEVLTTVAYAHAEVPEKARRRAVYEAALRVGMREVDALHCIEEMDLAHGTEPGTPVVP